MLLLFPTVYFCLCTCLSYAAAYITPDIIAPKYRLSQECDHLDKCQSRHFPDSLEHYNCHCGSFCSKLNTCCLDSPFREADDDRKIPRPVCRKMIGKFASSYFMIDKCPSKGDWNDIYQNLCEDESIENSNLTLVIPVTSLSTNTTYKNYFCFMFHETSTEYISWSAKVREIGKSNRSQFNDVLFQIQYVNNTWMAPVEVGRISVPVVFAIGVPPEIRIVAKVCIPDMVSSCSEKWPDDEIRTKCGMYMSAIYISHRYGNTWYRNPHCALCNFEDLKYAKCTGGAHQVHSLHSRDLRCRNPKRRCWCHRQRRCCRCPKHFSHSELFYQY